MTMNIDFTPDVNLKMKDSGAITASAAWLVSAASKIHDTSPSGVVTWAQFVCQIKVSALDIVSNDELYDLRIEGSTSATFASTIVVLATLRLGALEVIGGDGDVDSTPGTYYLMGHNKVDETLYRYLRGYSVISGTSPSVTHQAWLTGGKFLP